MPEVLTDRKSHSGRSPLLPYQQAWRRDTSRLKLWEKSRRIGATWAESNDATLSRLAGRVTSDYWFSSADESAAYEFAEYCRHWLRLADQVTEIVTDHVLDDRGVAAKAFVVRLPNGSRITAMSSSPRRFRSKGGDVCLDEFAYHDDPAALWDAAYPTITWGDRLRVLSTHNGEGTLFAGFCEMARRHRAGRPARGDMPWSLHRVTLHDACDQGLVERINETKGRDLTVEQFVAQCRAGCRSEDQWRQEYLAEPATDNAAWLPYDLIDACAVPGWQPHAGDDRGPIYVGCDVGESRDLTVIWTLQRIGDVLHTLDVRTFRDEPLRDKEAALLAACADPRVVRCCVDATGVGAQIAQAAERTGKGEGVKFSSPVNDQLAAPLRGLLEDRRLRLPDGSEVREDLHSIRMIRTAGGHPRYDAARTQAGHADRFWALALAVYAAASKTDAGMEVIW